MILIPRRNSKGTSLRLGKRLREQMTTSALVAIVGWGLGAWFLRVPSARAGAGQGPSSYVPPAGFVLDSTTAIRVAEAVLIPVYGIDQIARERPFAASQMNETWTVRGHLAAGRTGGVAVVEIARSSGCII